MEVVLLMVASDHVVACNVFDFLLFLRQFAIKATAA